MIVKPLWTKSGVLVMDGNGAFPACECCACASLECEPAVIASFITNSTDPSRAEWDLREFQGDGIGSPCAVWRLRDVGESHWHDPLQPCSGLGYGSGKIDRNGKLVGLPDKFVTGYSYDGYMVIEQGCPNSDGSVTWSCP